MSLLLRHRALGFRDAGGYNPDYFVFKINMADAGTFAVPTENVAGYNGEINFGDSPTWYPFTAYNDIDLTHEYTAAGNYVIQIRGAFPRIYFNNGIYAPYVTGVVQWGNVNLLSVDFSGCSNASGDLPELYNTFTNILFQNATFSGSAKIPTSVTILGNYIFLNCVNMTGTLTLHNNITSIGNRTFSQCGFVSQINLPSSLSTLTLRAFKDSTGFYGGLTMPNGITSIAAEVFDGCTGLNGTLNLHSGVTAIGNYSFRGCAFNLVNCYASTAPTVGTSGLALTGAARELHVPVGATGYDVAPWTNTSIFSSVIYDL